MRRRRSGQVLADRKRSSPAPRSREGCAAISITPTGRASRAGPGIRPNRRSPSRSNCSTGTICWRRYWRANTAPICSMPGSDGRHGFTIGFSETLLPLARHTLHLRPVGAKTELPSFPLELTRAHIGLDASAMRFLLGNVAAETARAQEPDDLAPMINNLVELLDQALSQYHALAAGKAALATADMLNPAALTAQVQTLVESIQRNYAIHQEEAEHPVVSII